MTKRPERRSGLSAAEVVSTSSTTLTGTVVKATGCDIGIYVAPGTSTVTITHVNVTGANDHGIFVQNASHVTISTSTVEGNGAVGGVFTFKDASFYGSMGGTRLHAPVVGGAAVGVTATP